MGISTWRAAVAAAAIGISTCRVGTTATVRIYTWRAGVATLCIASIEDTTASTYDFHVAHGKANVIM
jgi:hypothetical protein